MHTNFPFRGKSNLKVLFCAMYPESHNSSFFFLSPSFLFSHIFTVTFSVCCYVIHERNTTSMEREIDSCIACVQAYNSFA